MEQLFDGFVKLIVVFLEYFVVCVDLFVVFACCICVQDPDRELPAIPDRKEAVSSPA